MRARGGFTLVEITCVIAILAIVSGAFLDMYSGMYRELHSVAQQADARAESQRAAAVVFGRLAADRSAHIDADNHGLTFTDGSRMYWDGRGLVRMTSDGPHPVTRLPVTDFSITRANGVFTLTLVTLDGRRSGRFVADWPRQEGTEGGTPP